jgi:hypothetical protein
VLRIVLVSALVLSTALMTLAGVTPGELVHQARQLLTAQLGALRGF